MEIDIFHARMEKTHLAVEVENRNSCRRCMINVDQCPSFVTRQYAPKLVFVFAGMILRIPAATAYIAGV